jgi:hypothetical protein
VAATTPTTKQAASFLPGNGPTLFGRFLRSTIGKIISVAVILVAFIAVIRWINKPVRQARAGKP